MFHTIYSKTKQAENDYYECIVACHSILFGTYRNLGFFHLGRSYSSRSSSDQKHLMKSHEYKNGKSNRKFWERIFVSATHCGAGCTIGDVLSTWIIFIGSILLFGSVLITAFILDFTFAWLLGIIFQYFAILPGYPIYISNSHLFTHNITSVIKSIRELKERICIPVSSITTIKILD